MKNQFTLLVALVIVIFLLSYMFAFQVRYDQVAVVTTFGHATPPAYNSAGKIIRNAKGNVTDPGSLKFEPGLYFKWPWPIQKVTKYSTKVRILKSQPVELQTADNNAIIVTTYLAWRIKDPDAFFRSMGNITRAKKQLTPLLYQANNIISSYNFTDLVNSNPKQLKIKQIEQQCAASIQAKLASITPSYGIKVLRFGIDRMVLPKGVTTHVFARMRATREALAQKAKSEGKARAVTITSKAKSQKQRILAFANRQAQALRTLGDQQAAKYYTAFSKDPQFAIFLRQIQALQKMLGHNTTFIVNSNDLGPMNLLKNGSDALLKTDENVTSPSSTTSNKK